MRFILFFIFPVLNYVNNSLSLNRIKRQKTQLKTKKKQIKSKLENTPPLTMVWLAFFLVLCLPVIIFLISWTTGKDHGPIGDTLGGSTAPTIGFLSAILIYLSFKAQIDANKAVREESNFRYILDEFKNIKETFNNFEFTEGKNTLTGKAALKKMVDEIYQVYEIGLMRNRDEGWDFSDDANKASFLLKNYTVFINEVLVLNLSDSNRSIVQSRIWLHYSEFLHQQFQTISQWKTENITSIDSERHQNALNLKLGVLDLSDKIEIFEQAYNKTKN